MRNPERSGNCLPAIFAGLLRSAVQLVVVLSLISYFGDDMVGSLLVMVEETACRRESLKE